MAWAGALRPPGTAATLALRQERRLRKLIRHCAEASPYYRTVFADLSLSPDDIRTAADLPRLPVLDKATAQARLADIAGKNAPRTRMRHSNGTTGTPFHMPVSWADGMTDAWLWAVGYLAAGHPWFGLQAKIGRVNRPAGERPFAAQIGPVRRAYLSPNDSPEAKVTALARLRPASLVCWASILDELTCWLEHHDRHLAVPLVFSTSDVLTADVRRRAGQRLGAQVRDIYGAMETGPVAWECPVGGGYHIHSDLVIVELVDDGDHPAQAGRVVCTVLWRRAFPLVRYDLGDVAEWLAAPCPCGSPYPRLRSLYGRDDELIQLPDGTRINSEMLRDLIAEAPGVRQYQLVQATPTHFVARIVPTDALGPEARQHIEAAFSRRFGPILSVEARIVDQIRQPPEIKFTPMVTLKRQQRIRAAGGDPHTLFGV